MPGSCVLQSTRCWRDDSSLAPHPRETTKRAGPGEKGRRALVVAVGRGRRRGLEEEPGGGGVWGGGGVHPELILPSADDVAGVDGGAGDGEGSPDAPAGGGFLGLLLAGGGEDVGSEGDVEAGVGIAR